MEGEELEKIKDSVASVSHVVTTGDIILFEQYSLLRRTWMWVLIAAVLVAGGVGAYYFLAVPVQYSSVVRLLPPNKSGTPLDNLIGGVASTLKDFGLSRLVGKGATASGYSASVILTSQPLYDSLIRAFDLHREYDIPTNRRDRLYDEIAGNIDVRIEDEGPVSITVFDTSPRTAARMADSVVRYTNSIAQDLNRRETEPISRYIGRQLAAKREEQERIQRELSAFLVRNRLFDPEGQTPAIGQAILDAETNLKVRREVHAFYRSNLGEEDPLTLQAAGQLKVAEQEAARLRSGAGGVVSGPNLEQLPGNSVEYARLRVDYEGVVKYLAILEPMYEQSKFDELRTIPVFNVLDPPQVPVKKARPKRSIIIASSFVATVLLGYLFIFVSAYWRSFTRRYNSYAMMRDSVATHPSRRHRAS